MSLTTLLFGTDTTRSGRRWNPAPASKEETRGALRHTDCQGRTVRVSYRVTDACLNNQTDESRLQYDITAVTYLGRKVRLSAFGREMLHDWLCLSNPECI